MLPMKVTFSTAGIEAGLAGLQKKVQEKVLRAGAGAMSSVIRDEAQTNTLAHIKTGKLHDAIYQYHHTDQSNADRQVYLVSWNRRKAPHGHLLEYGTSKAPAYPFMRPAFERIEDAIRAGQERMAEAFKDR